MRARRLVLALVLAMVLTSCVGQARTAGAYRGKASHSASEAASALQTALLAVQTSEKGNLLGFYLEVILRRAEDDFSSIQQQFDSIQPPNTKQADDLRDRLDQLLTKGSDTLSQIRILSRRDDQAEMLRTARGIPPLVQKLDKFAEATS